MKKSPYEKGLYFVDPEPGSTLQSIGTTEWNVGERYELVKVLGYGSFSCVCLAKDMYDGGSFVALKRIGNVLQSHEQTKRVLREISILRRINHPHVIQLKDVFLRPSSTGQCRLIDNKLVHCSMDLYISTEFAEGGDVFHLKGNLREEEVVDMMWQMLSGLQYLHSMGIWHRDVKSQNAFVFRDPYSGKKVIKWGDFGSSIYYQDVRRSSRVMMDRDDSFHYSSGASGASDMLERVVDEKRGGFKAPLTRVVATPCYRAPEVVMSRGRYTDAIDMWGLGCIFGEMLARIAYVGSASNFNLQVAPMFALRELPKTPSPGETFGTTTCSMTRKELQALFDVIGTPVWKDAEALEMEEWRAYLAKLPGKAPTLQRRFRSAGEVAVHLLSRLLEFDPSRRATCEEAMMHEYFDSFDSQQYEDDVCFDSLGSMKIVVEEEDGGNLAQALSVLERELEDIMLMNGPDDGDCFSEKSRRLMTLLESECHAVQQGQIAYKIKMRDPSAMSGLSFRDISKRSGGFEEDRHGLSRKMSDSEYARDRMSNVADTWQGRELDPTKFLGAHRHGEWSASSSSGIRQPAGSSWGVSLPEDPRMREAIKKQQER